MHINAPAISTFFLIFIFLIIGILAKCYNPFMDENTSPFPIINNRYQILNTIANGGMSVVYRARDLTLDRIIALKILRKSLSENNIFSDRFRSEAKSTAKLTHPNIVTTFDFGVDNKRLFLVLEFIDGHDLKYWINKNKIISLSMGLDLIIQASKGLAYAHQQGIVHCDIKSQNMLISDAQSLKITDFGISRALDDITRSERLSEIWASPYYVSPEQAQGLPPSPASDVYSLGIVMYEVFTGKLPFYGNDALELINKHQIDNFISPSSVNAAISPSLESIISTSLKKDPDDRYKNGQEVLNALNSIKLISTDSLSKTVIDQINSEDKSPPIKSFLIKKETDFDWSTIILSFFVIILVGGLIPFWIYIYFSINR
jgi:eukaryotic-like serine/threonine-protein kinase